MDQLLADLITCFGVSGHEDDVRSIIKRTIKNINCNIFEDKLGNIIVKIGAGNEKLMLYTHMDSIGVVATDILDNGFIRVERMGDFNAFNFVNTFVKFQNYTIGKIHMTLDQTLYIDIGTKSKNDTLKKVREGDVACLAEPYLKLEDNIFNPFLSCRIGCYVMLKTLIDIKQTEKQIYFVFAAKQQLNYHGINTVIQSILPNYCISINVVEANDVVGQTGDIQLGSGPILSMIEDRAILQNATKKKIEAIAEKEDKKNQYLKAHYKYNQNTMWSISNKTKIGEILIPCRYMNSSSESVCLNDIKSTIKLLKEII